MAGKRENGQMGQYELQNLKGGYLAAWLTSEA
jgi:hypothetical protein